MHFVGSFITSISQCTVLKMSKILNIYVICYWYFIPQSQILSCIWLQEDRLSYIVLAYWMIYNVQHVILHVPNVLTGYMYLIYDADTIGWMPWFLSWSGSRATELPRLSCWHFWMTVTTDTSLWCSMHTLRWGGAQ